MIIGTQSIALAATPDRITFLRGASRLYALTIFQLVGCNLLNVFLLFLDQGDEILLSVAGRQFSIGSLLLLSVQLAMLGSVLFATTSLMLNNLGSEVFSLYDYRVKFVIGGMPWILAIGSIAPVLLAWFGMARTARAVYILVIGALLVSLFGVIPKRLTERMFNSSSVRMEKVGPWILSIALLYSWILFIAVVVEKVWIAQFLGPIGVLISSVVFWVTNGSIFLVYLPKRAGWPALTIPALLSAVLFSTWVDNHPLRTMGYTEVHESLHNDPILLDEYIDLWLEKREIKSGQYFPIYVVAAAGGGIRAAQWTAMTLAEIEAASQGKFSAHLFAISGVSGGSLGGSAFVAALADRQHEEATYDNESLKKNLREFVKTDFLSPVLAHLLLPDSVQRFLPFPVNQFDRSLALETAWETKWRNVYHTDRMKHGLRALYQDDQELRLPLLFLNSTQVETGARFIFTPVKLPANDFPGVYSNSMRQEYGGGSPDSVLGMHDIPLSAAIHASARFTYVSPPARLDFNGYSRTTVDFYTMAVGIREMFGRQAWGRLVDGGYFENSGSITAGEIIDRIENRIYALKQAGRVPKDTTIEVHPIVILNSPMSVNRTRPVRASWPALAANRVYPEDEETIFPIRGFFLGEIYGPIQALLSVREARGDHATESLWKRLNPHDPICPLINHCRDGKPRDFEKENAEVRERDPNYWELYGKHSYRVMQEQIARCPLPTKRFHTFYLSDVEYSVSEDGYFHPEKNMKKLREPALGWTLSEQSSKYMEQQLSSAVNKENICEILYELNYHSPKKQ